MKIIGTMRTMGRGGANATKGIGMFLLSAIGGIFSAVTLGIIAVAISIGGVLWMYGRDLPNYELSTPLPRSAASIPAKAV